MATVIGDGGHAEDIIQALESSPYCRVVHRATNHRTYIPLKGQSPYIGINDPRLRASVAEELGVMDMQWLHPNAWVGPSCTIDYGTHINYGATMTRTDVGHHTTISPGVTICGDVTIGDRTLIGAGAVICNLVTIGNDVTIGAGTVVLPNTTIEDGATYVGNPARRIK